MPEFISVNVDALASRRVCARERTGINFVALYTLLRAHYLRACARALNTQASAAGKVPLQTCCRQLRIITRSVLYAPLRAPVTWRSGDPRFCDFLLESKLSAIRTLARSRCKTYAAWFSFAAARGATECHKPSVTVIWCQLPEREDLRATRTERFNFFISVILTGGRQTVAPRAKK